MYGIFSPDNRIELSEKMITMAGVMMKKRIISHFLLMIMILSTGVTVLSAGCSSDTKEAELTPIDFTVVSFEDIPKELAAEIESKKNDDFRITYTVNGWLYIARGYGMQNSGGYSIAVKEVSGADNAVYFDSELVGPRQGEAVNRLATYPYVVIKLEDSGQSVVFR